MAPSHMNTACREPTAPEARADPELPLKPKLPAPPANRATQVLELRLDEMVDAVARRRDVVVEFLFDLVARNPIPRLDAAIPREAGAALGVLRSGFRRAPGRPDGTASRWTAAEQ